MSSLALEISKTAVQLLADKVKSAIKEEAEKWQIVQRDLVFIKGEFEMMQAFLEIGDAQHIKNNVGKTWVRQVNDLSYDTEDWMEFVLHLDAKRSWWLPMLPSCVQGAAHSSLDEAVAEIKQLKARVEDVSQRKMRYDLISDVGSNPVAQMQKTLAASTRALDVFVKATEAEKDHIAAMQLKGLVATASEDLRVMSVCGTGGDFGTTSIIKQVYEDSDICSYFKLRAWVRIADDTSGLRLVFLRDLASQFVRSSEDEATIDDMLDVSRIDAENKLGEILDDLLDSNRFLIVLEDLSSVALWYNFRAYLPDTNNGSRIIVATKTLEMASLCTERPYTVSVIRQFSADQSVCVFFKEEMQRDTVCADIANKLEEHINTAGQQCTGSVIFVWWKSDLVRTVYESCTGLFDKYAWVYGSQQLDIENFCQSLFSALFPDHCASERRRNLLDQCRCLVVIEGLESEDQWDSIKDKLIPKMPRSCFVVITSKVVARRCAKSVKYEYLYFLKKKGIRFGYVMPTDLRSFMPTDLPSFMPTDLPSFMPADYDIALPQPLLMTSMLNDNFHLHGRHCEQKKLEKHITSASSAVGSRVLSVWGLPGVGKTKLVRSVFEKLKNNNTETLFDRYAWVNVSSKGKEIDIVNELSQYLLQRQVHQKILQELFEGQSFLLVIDDLESEIQWDSISHSLKKLYLFGSGNCIVVISGKESVARYCAEEKHLFRVDPLEAVAVRDLVINNNEKVERRIPGSRGNIEKQEPHVRSISIHAAISKNLEATGEETSNSDYEMPHEVEGVISECDGRPGVVRALRSYLAGRPAEAIEKMRRLKANFMQVLEINQELSDLCDVLTKIHCSFDALPQVLKKCTFYLSIFRQSNIIRRRRLVRRWIAEGYSTGSDSNSMVYYTEKLFHQLANLGIIKPQPHAITTVTGDMRMPCLQVISLFLDYIMSREKDEKILVPLEVSVLEGDCNNNNLNSERVGHHLVIRESWKRDGIVLESLDLSRLRSLTVFGKWLPCFVTNNRMRVLRVLDLEGTSNVKDEDLKQIGEFLPRLKFLSIRGCTDVTRLPASIGNLGQLQTLDIRETSIIKLPKSIIKLRKLQYIRAGPMVALEKTKLPKPRDEEAEQAPFAPTSPASLSRWVSKLREHLHASVSSAGIAVPPGIAKLTALHTLGVVNINTANGMAILQELKKLTQLRKLGLSGISRGNSRHLSLVSNLESLSLHFQKGKHAVRIDDIKLPTKLRSLKLYGHIESMPKSIKDDLHDLVKLSLDITTLGQEDVQVLGELKNLHTLRLCVDNVPAAATFTCDKLQFRGSIFPGLHILGIASTDHLHVTFIEKALNNLKLLQARCSGSLLTFSGLKHLVSLKQVFLSGSNNNTLKEVLQSQLDEHLEKPVLKLESNN